MSDIRHYFAPDKPTMSDSRKRGRNAAEGHETSSLLSGPDEIMSISTNGLAARRKGGLNVYNGRSAADMLRLLVTTRDLVRWKAAQDEEEDTPDAADDVGEGPDLGMDTALTAGAKDALWDTWRPYLVHRSRAPVAARWFSTPDDELGRLSDEQRQAMFLVEAGLSAFVTGPGGTGKSEIIKLITKYAPNVAITASTGIAAMNIGGTTLHRFAGLGLAQKDLNYYIRVANMRSPDDARVACWLRTDVLVVDEVSMLSLAYLDKLDKIATHCRRKHRDLLASPERFDSTAPFGGIQLVFLGDFAQLTMNAGESIIGMDTSLWPRLVPYTVLLSTIFRQKDAMFKGLLNRARVGRPSGDDFGVLSTCSMAKEHAHRLCESGVLQLCYYRNQARQLNDFALQKLCEGPLQVYRHVFVQGRLVKPSPEQPPRFVSDGIEGPAAGSVADAVLGASELRVDLTDERIRTTVEGMVRDKGLATTINLRFKARVLLTMNLSPADGLVNGAVGTVVGFTCKPIAPAVAASSSSEEAGAASTEPVEEEDKEQETDPTPADMACLVGTCGEIVQLPYTPLPTPGNPNLPVVRFDTSPDQVYAIPMQNMSVDVQELRKKGDSTQRVVRLQTMPLLCAWAITVHRAQGMTLEKVAVHADDMKEHALLYTALSRVKSISGLRIIGEPGRKHFAANPSAVKYYRSLEDMAKAQAGLFVLLSRNVIQGA